MRWRPPRYLIEKSENPSSRIKLWVLGALSSERSSVMMEAAECSGGGGGRMGLIIAGGGGGVVVFTGLPLRMSA
ncbi:hypothetical protein Tco_0018383 [Tanacetum coccineum]